VRAAFSSQENTMRVHRALLSLLVSPFAAFAQTQVVGDEACPKYAVDMAYFATCDGDRVARPSVASTLHVTAVAPQDVPPLKRTDSGRHVTAAEADRIRQAYPGRFALIDIRSRLEVVYAGQPDAVDIHVPFREPVLPLQWNAASNGPKMQRNPAFVDAVKAELARLDWPDDSILLLLCRSGEMSAIAADALTAAGLPHVFTIVDGFEGDLGASGRRDVNGWKNAGGRWQAQPVARLAAAGQ
jgi:rhodanese-related sulfurtransferase